MKGKEKRSFRQAIESEPEKCRGSENQCRNYSYVDRGFYTEQLRRILRHFPREQLLILRSEEFFASPEKVLPVVWEFLGVGKAPITPLSKEEAHVRPHSQPLCQEDRDRLLYLYEYEIRQLERFLDWDCSAWLSGTPSRQRPSQ